MSACLKLQDGEVVFGEGDKGADVYFILEGEVEIKKQVEGEEVHIATLEAGDFFGEMELISPSREGRAASVTAKGAVKLLQLAQESFLECVNKTACGRQMLMFFARVIVERLRKMDDAYTELFLQSKGKGRLSELQTFRQKLIKEWGF